LSPADGQPLETCSILTTTPNAVLETLHDRTPVIPPSNAYGVWFDPVMCDVGRLQCLLTPYPADAMIT
jgi:putative SOS response-associated peptidase YedK